MSEHPAQPQPELHGVMVELPTAQALLSACRKAQQAGYLQMEAYAPFPVHGLHETLNRQPTRLPRLVLLGAIAGGVGGYLMQWFAMTVHYPLNIGGRPLHSWPYFLPITFELAILLAAFAAVLGMLVRNGLPQPYHPVFNVERFRRASQDTFFLCIEATDPQFDLDKTRQFLISLARKPEEVFNVEA